MRILVTGANGFIGRALLHNLQLTNGTELIAGVRNLDISTQIAGVRYLALGDLGEFHFDPELLRGVDVIVHCAARVHVMYECESDPLEAFRRVNVRGSLALARAAIEADVKRFVFLSSIKVNGEETVHEGAFRASDIPSPLDAYGLSKLEAELGLQEMAREGQMDIVIVRPPLVYGPGVKANFLNMMRWLNRGIPLPFGGISNKRSLIGLPNLVDFLTVCMSHPNAANQVFLVSDGDDLSITDLLQRIALALGRPARLLNVPAWLLQFFAGLLGRTEIAQRLCGSLQVNIEKNKDCLGWVPPFTCDQALSQTVEHFRKEHK